MKPLKYIFILTALPLLLQQGRSAAQYCPQKEEPPQNFWEGGCYAGTAVYQGDLVPSLMGSFKDAAPVGGITAGYYFKHGIGLSTTIAVGGLRGDDAQWSRPEWRRQRRFSFKTGFGEWSLVATYDCLARLRERKNKIKWGLVMMAGGGVVYTNPSRDVSGLDSVAFSPGDAAVSGLKQDMDRSPATWTGLLILGGGIRYYVNKRTAVYTEVRLHCGSSDRMDGFRNAVSSSRPDGYMTYTVGYSVRIR